MLHFRAPLTSILWSLQAFSPIPALKQIKDGMIWLVESGWYDKPAVFVSKFGSNIQLKKTRENIGSYNFLDLKTHIL